MNKTTAYIEFLKRKNQLTSGAGLQPVEMHPSLFPHQRDIVDWAVCEVLKNYPHFPCGPANQFLIASPKVEGKTG